MANTPTREHREAATTLVRFVASAWVEDPTATYGLATPELELLRKVSHLLADAEQRGFERGREAERAEVVSYLRQPEHDAADLAHNIESGRHLALKPAKRTKR